jgi:flagellar hook-associated protein FlgK
VPIEVGGGRLYAPVTTLAAGMENPVIYLDNVKPGQQLQLLTQDGRHLIGSEMSIDEKYQLLSKENGFSEPVTFSDAYLNKSGPDGYLNTHVFYGAKGSVVYAQQFDRLGQPAAPTPTPAKLETAHIQQLQAGATGLTLIANGAIKLNNNELGPLVLAARETLTPQKVAAWLQKGLDDNKITDMRVEVYNQIRFNVAALDFHKPLSINGIKIGTVNQDAKVANEYKDLSSMVKAIQAAKDRTGVTARIADNGDLIMENALGHEGETINLGPKDVNGQSFNAFNLNLSGSNGLIQGQVRLTRTLGDPAKSDIRLSFGTSPNAGSPFDLSIVGLRTAAYIEGKVPDDLQVFVTGEGKASIAASFAGQPTDPQQKLRAQNLVVTFDAADHYTIKDSVTGTVLAERHYDNTVLNPVVNYQGLAIKFTRSPDVGDVFAVDGNHDGLGNNENMLVMVDLSKKGVIGNKSFSDSYIDQVNTVGNAAQQAKITQQALTVVNAQAKQSRDKVSGVNLDDEAADLIRFQQAYQAAAKSLQISGQLFDSIVQIR